MRYDSISYPKNSQMAGRELRDLLFSPHSSIVLLTVLHTDIHLGSAYTPLHFGLSLCNLLQHVWLPYPRWKGTSIALIWGIVGLYKCCIYREIKCRNFPSDPALYIYGPCNSFWVWSIVCLGVLGTSLSHAVRFVTCVSNSAWPIPIHKRIGLQFIRVYLT